MSLDQTTAGSLRMVFSPLLYCLTGQLPSSRPTTCACYFGVALTQEVRFFCLWQLDDLITADQSQVCPFLAFIRCIRSAGFGKHTQYRVAGMIALRSSDILLSLFPLHAPHLCDSCLCGKITLKSIFFPPVALKQGRSAGLPRDWAFSKRLTEL